jgi:hypothetical protein
MSDKMTPERPMAALGRTPLGAMCEREGPGSADDDLVARLRDPDEVCPTFVRERAADKIEAHARHVEHWRGSFINEQKENEALKARVARLTEANAELMHALDTAIACLDAGLGKGAADGTSLPRILAKHRAALAEAPDAH